MNRRVLSCSLAALLLFLCVPSPAGADTQTGVCPTIGAGGALPRRAPAVSADGSHLYFAVGSEIVSIAVTGCNGFADWGYAGSGSQGITQLIPDEAHGRIWGLNGIGSNLVLLNTNGTRLSGPTSVATSSTGRAALRSALGLLYIPVPGDGTISVRNENGLEAGPITVGGAPVAVVISPDGTRAYVADDTGSAVKVLDLTQGTTWAQQPIGALDGAAITVGAHPAALALSPDGSLLLVGSTGDNTVSFIDTGTRQVVATVPVTSPQAIAITPDGTRAYVASGGAVVAVDLVGRALGGSVTVGGGLTELAMSPDGLRLFAGQAADGMLADLSLDVPPAITTPAGPLPGGKVGSAYSAALAASGSPAPQFAVTAGTLPAGLSLAPDGTISGTPTAAGTATATVRAGATVSGIAMGDTRTITISVAPRAPAIAPALPTSWVRRWPAKTGRYRTAHVGKRLAITGVVLSATGKAQHARIGYRWYVAGKAVARASGLRFVVRKVDRGRPVTVRVTVSRTGYQARARTISFGRAR